MFFIPLVVKVHRLAAVIFEIKTASPNFVLVQHCREISLIKGVEDLIVQHLTSVYDAVELQRHKNTHKKIVNLTVQSKNAHTENIKNREKDVKNGSVHITHYWVDFLRQLVPVIVLHVLPDKKQRIIGAGLLGGFSERLPPPIDSGQLEVGHLLESCIYDWNFCKHMLVTFYRIHAFHEGVVRVQHINAIMHEVETIHKVMSCILDRDKDLVQKNKSAGNKND
jgi:hypothetical protein